MDNNQENVVEVQGNNPEESKGKGSGKKVCIIVGAVALIAVVAVVLVYVFGGVGKGKLNIEGEIYSHSAEEGIKGIKNASDGVVVCEGASATFYPASGGAEEVDI